MSIPQCIISEFPDTHAFNDGIKDFDGVFLEILVKNCIVGMLLTYPIRFSLSRKGKIPISLTVY